MHFETGSARLSKASDTQLAAALKAYPKVTISVRGHTDNTGGPEANKKLSGDRAAAVKQALEAGRARNRRVELIVVRS